MKGKAAKVTLIARRSMRRAGEFDFIMCMFCNRFFSFSIAGERTSFFSHCIYENFSIRKYDYLLFKLETSKVSCTNSQHFDQGHECGEEVLI